MSTIKRGSLVTATLAVVVVACGSSTPAPATPVSTTDPYGAYYPQQPACDPSQPGCVAQPGYAPPAYPTQPGYPAPAQPAYPAQPAPAAAMSTPGPFALPCTNDASCLTARCNTQYSKCTFPCQSAADCATGATCNAPTGLCLPGG